MREKNDDSTTSIISSSADVLHEPIQLRSQKYSGLSACHKRVHLGVSEPGIFRYRGREVLHHHILPIAQAAKNLLQEAASSANAFLKANPRKRHKYFHHLNSSQAFAFNLFFPYFSAGGVAAASLLRALGQNGELLEWEPEAVPDSNERSNIDVLWTTTDGTKTFCEVKLSEAEFGKASDDDRHRDKLLRIYSPTLTGHLKPHDLESSSFFGAYQFNRNLWYMVNTDQSRLIFLLPRTNVGLWLQLQKFLARVAPPTRKRVSAIAIEDVIGRLSIDNLCPANLREHAKQLGLKYLLRNRTDTGSQTVAAGKSKT